MSLYALQKLIRDVNRLPVTREAFMRDAAGVAVQYELTEAERAALLARDWAALYRLGVHGLLLRPFSILHQVPEPAYLSAIRGEAA
jgi:Aromatic-ring-opening dioxygenase LigAB, LigA subunit